MSSPGDLTTFVRWYARRAQNRFRPGNSEPAGPGKNEAGLGVFRYRTRCGTMYGHTGNFLGYTAFIAASRDGRRSVTIQVSTQVDARAAPRPVYQALRRAFALGVCAAFS